ncbi:Metallo-dependent phosphatase-like protein [Nemania sp. NC0429]|nr:Metallo-dependent phosphatase-like protein [Nemania sp. NC0429]
MSLFTPQFQVLSDLHLERPLGAPLYETFPIPVKGSHIFLLGDIGLVLDDALFHFFRSLLQKMRGSRFFYVMGNHEAYRTTLPDAVRRLRAFEKEAIYEFGGRFVFLNRGRFDVDANTTILGCTLWSDVLPQQAPDVKAHLTDFDEQKGIHNWSLESHLEEHWRDRDWLNSQICILKEKEPHRRIIIATHYSPTLDKRAVEPEHQGSGISSAFATDMSKDPCWLSAAVKLWVFGHTHYNCGFRDEATDKLVIANQRGYAGAEVLEVLVEPDVNGFKIMTPSQKTKSQKLLKLKPLPELPKPETVPKMHYRALLDRVADRISRAGQLRSRMMKLRNKAGCEDSAGA